MKTDFTKMYVALTVLSIENYKAQLVVEMGDDPDNMEVAHLSDVLLSGLANYRIDNNTNNNYTIGRRYMTVNNSKDFKACPFTLIRTADSKGRLMYVLKIVNEDTFVEIERTTPNGNPVIHKMYKDSRLPSTWIRYVDVYDKKKEAIKAKAEAEVELVS